MILFSVGSFNCIPLLSVCIYIVSPKLLKAEITCPVLVHHVAEEVLDQQQELQGIRIIIQDVYQHCYLFKGICQASILAVFLFLLTLC